MTLYLDNVTGDVLDHLPTEWRRDYTPDVDTDGNPTGTGWTVREWPRGTGPADVPDTIVTGKNEWEAKIIATLTRYRPITHYAEGNNGGSDRLCTKCGCADPTLEPMTSDADDFDDRDGRQLECDSCGDPLFPAAYAEYEAEHRYIAAQYRSGALGASIGRTRDAALEAMQRDDPVAFYIACKDDPDAIEAEVERRVSGR